MDAVTLGTLLFVEPVLSLPYHRMPRR